MICQGKKVKLFVGDQEIIGSESFTINTEEIECSQCTYYNEDEHGNLDCWPIAICVNKSEFTKDLQREDTLKRYDLVDETVVEVKDGEWVRFEDAKEEFSRLKANFMKLPVCNCEEQHTQISLDIVNGKESKAWWICKAHGYKHI